MKKILFIDIDGVLVTEWSCMQQKRTLGDFNDYEPYAPKCVEALNKIISAIHPLLIISSNRRFQSDIDTFRKIWDSGGIEYERLAVLESVGEGTVFTNSEAEKENDINEYIRRHALDSEEYIVIDDENLHVKNLIVVYGKNGLGMENAGKAISFFT